MKLQEEIVKLTEYGVRKRLIEESDRIYTINRYLELFGLDSVEVSAQRVKQLCQGEIDLHEVLENLVDKAFELGLMENDGITQRDLFDTKLMGILTPRPSAVISDFQSWYAKSPEAATEYFYTFSRNTNYIRTDRIKKDRRWKVSSPYGDIDITINLSKPEKDPKAIAAAKNMKNSQYPSCQLCRENEGYAGRIDHPARQNHRIIPLEIQGKPWGFQYSPYVYYNEHCIVFSGAHEPMKIERATFEKLLHFIDQFPHYFLGSNADLPIVGGSILSHDHFQGGHYTFAMETAKIEKTFTVPGFEEVEAGIVHWPLSVIRIRSKNRSQIIDLAAHILDQWRGYTDEATFVFAETDGEPHNTITPIARKKHDQYELDLTLRNNITTKEHPLGVYHPHAEHHHIKKENIGLIEVMGLAVLPARLNREMERLADCLVNGKAVDTCDELKKHKVWAEKIAENHTDICAENIDEILQEEIGKVFVKVLEDAGVYKCDPKGREGFERFIRCL